MISLLLLVVSFCVYFCLFFFFSSRRRHTRLQGDWSSDVCSSDLTGRRYASSRWRGATIAPPPTTSAAAPPPQPLPFLGRGCWAAGRLGLGPGREGVGGCGVRGGLGGGRLGDAGGWEGGDAGLGGALGAVEWGVRSICVPPPFAMLRASSLGSNTSCTSPSRTVAPGASGASPFTCSPSTNVPLVESRSTSTHTPSRRCSLAWVVDTDGSGTTRSL